jgi:hypothetical protein
MSDDSLEELLEWDISQNKTVTAWSSQVSAKNRGRKTYSRRRAGSSTLQRRASFTSRQDFSETSDAFSSLDEELDPPFPPPTTLARANSVTIHDRLQAPRMRRANSISHSSTSSTATMLRRSSSSTSRQSFGSLSDYAENLDPNLSALEEVERAKPVVYVRGRKKVRAENSVPRIPISNSFSNLAKFGEDGLSWARHSSSSSSIARATMDPLSPKLIQKKAILNDLDFPEFTESSPAATSVGSNRKRGICESPMHDFDDCSFSAAPYIQRSRFFSPASMPSPGFSIGESHGDQRRLPLRLGSSASNEQKRGSSHEFESDDALSDADDSGDDASTESMGPAATPMNRFTSFGDKQPSRSALGYSPENLLEPGKARADDVINSMASYQDLRFLVKSLRKEKAGSRISWHVAPPVAWDSSRRAAFFQWTTRSLGFSFRAGGMAIAYLQISKTKGAGMLELLESAVSSYRQSGLGDKDKTPNHTIEKPKFNFSISKEPPARVSRTLSLTPKEYVSDFQEIFSCSLFEKLTTLVCLVD